MSEKLSNNIKIIIEVLAKGKDKAKALASEFDDLSKSSSSAGKNVGVADKAVNSLGGSAARANERLRDSHGRIARVGESAEGASSKVKKLDSGFKSVSSSSKSAGNNMAALAAKIGKIVAIAGTAAYVGKMAIDFESSMADVRKVVDGTAEDIGNLRSEILQMTREIPQSAGDLAAIAAAAGQLGVKTNEIKGFTETVSKMSTAFNMTAEQAGTSMGKIKNIFGLSTSQLTGFGDVINQLGNTTAAKESEIVDSMMRIGGAAKVFGLAIPEASALSAAFIALGKPPETAAMAINAMLSKLQTAEAQGPKFQAALTAMGVTSTQLADNIKKGPNDAILGFLGTLKEIEGADRAKILVDLFGLEYQDDISLLVEGLDSYKAALGNVADETAYAGSMQREFEVRSKTVANQLQLTKNAINEVAINFGTVFLPAIRSAAEGVADLTHKFLGFFKENGQIAAAFDATGEAIARLFSKIAESPIGEVISASINLAKNAIIELSALILSGELGAQFDAWASKWKAWGDDITKSIGWVKENFSSEGEAIVEGWNWVVDSLKKAFLDFPENIRALIGLVTVALASEFDKMVAKAAWLKDSVAAIFTNGTLEGAMDKFLQQMAAIDQAKQESINKILQERDASIDSYKKMSEAAREYGAEQERERQRAKKGAQQTAETEKKSAENKKSEDENELSREKQRAKNLADRNKLERGEGPKKKAEEAEKDFGPKNGKGEGQGPKTEKEKDLYKQQLEQKRKTYTPEEFAERQAYWKKLEDERPLSKQEKQDKKAEEVKFNAEQREVKKAEKEKAAEDRKVEREDKNLKIEREKRKRRLADAGGGSFIEDKGDYLELNTVKVERIGGEEGGLSSAEDQEENDPKAQRRKRRDERRKRREKKRKKAAKGGIDLRKYVPDGEWDNLTQEQKDELAKTANQERKSYDYFNAGKQEQRFRGHTDIGPELKRQAESMLEQNRVKAEQEKYIAEKTKFQTPEERAAKRAEEEEARDKKKAERQAELSELSKKADAERAESAKKAEEEAMAANRERTELAKKTAEERAQAEIAATEKTRSVLQQYFDRVRQLQDEITGRSETLAEKLDKLNPNKGTEESRWQKMRKDAIAYEKAARAALALGDYDKAQAMADKAGSLYEGLKGGAGAVSGQVGDRAAFAGVKSAGELGIAIAKAQQSQAAKAALVATSGSGQAFSQARAAMGQIANQKVEKVHELRFKGGALQGSGPSIEALLDLLAKEGLAAG
jgi:TP901 family phage tail tape measure protein